MKLVQHQHSLHIAIGLILLQVYTGSPTTEHTPSKTVAPTPAVTDVSSQAYWRQHHPRLWPALSITVDYYRARLICNNPFAPNEIQRVYAESAFIDTFQDFPQFPIQEGMMKMVCHRILSRSHGKQGFTP